MHEGKNIHYSAVDQKPLCSFSGKICNQRRLNKYGFCVRHILEDTGAPFKRCAYVAKSSRQTCTQPIPKHEAREYCNNHMQVLGMLPKKERKPKKEKDKAPTNMSLSNSVHRIQLSTDNSEFIQNKVKSRLTMGGFKTKTLSNRPCSEDVDDVYAFPADNLDNTTKSKGATTMITSIAIPDMSSSATKPLTYSTFRSRSPNEGSGGHSSLAKIYPELAEKLEKIKPKVETAKAKGKVKSSRTMNSLQTKIAQNKIKDKIRRNQGSNASSQSQSPSYGLANSPGYHVSTNSPSLSMASPAPSPSVASPEIAQAQLRLSSHPEQTTATLPMSFSLNNSAPEMTSTMSTQSLPGLSQINMLNSLNFQTFMNLAKLGLPIPTQSDIEQTLKQLAKAANFPVDGAMLTTDSGSGLPPPMALAGLPTGTLVPPPDILGMLPMFNPQSGPPPPYSSVHHKPTVPIPTVASSKFTSNPNSTSGTGSLYKDQIQTKSTASMGMPVPSRPPVTTFAPNSSVSRTVPTVTALSSLHTSSVVKATSLSSQLSSLSSPTTSFVSSYSQQKLVSSTSSCSPISTTVSSVARIIDSVKQESLAAACQQKIKANKPRPSKVRNPSVASKRPVPVFTLPMTVAKPRKIRKLLDEKDLKKLKTESAIKYYNTYRQERTYNHDLILSGFDSSEDESDLSDCDILPWQPDWFNASSDEETFDDDLDFDLRTTKLALTRARLRRQCFQARHSHRMNTSVCEKKKQSTSALIHCARHVPKSAVACLNEIQGKQPKPVDKYKLRGLEKRLCLYKDDEDVQCKHSVVPYANHCIKHVMYNVDQQLFEYCTAKFADNTQCCHPVIDVKHELPLCIEHGLKADNFLKTQDSEPKPKRPRKKTKPSALTRPPKKGKKKKNQRKSTRAQKPVAVKDEPSAETEMSGTEEEGFAGSHDDDDAEDIGDDDSDSETTEAPSCTGALTKSALLKSTAPVKSTLKPVRPIQTVNTSMVPSSSTGEAHKVFTTLKTIPTSSTNQLEELNLNALSELDNVKMFGDLPLETASKLLEEHDFQDVFNKLPDEAFDLFTNKNSNLPSNEELEELEKSLAMANRDFNITKDTFDQMSTTGNIGQDQTIQQQHQQQLLPPILDDADELTRQIAEEIINQNLGQDLHLGQSMCNGDAQESIKAIARSLSNSGMMLAGSESSQKAVEGQTFSSRHNLTVPACTGAYVSSQSTSLSRSQSMQGFGNLGQVYNPPNVAINNIPPNQQVQNISSTFALSQGSFSQGQSSFNPRNINVNPQGILQAQFPSVSNIFTTISPNIKLSNAVITGQQLFPGNQNASIISLGGNQALTAQQVSHLVQQGSIQLPPLPPYTSRPQATTTSNHLVNTTAIQTPAVQSTKQLSQKQITHQIQQQQQQLARQQEQLTRQQNMLTQQLLQQRIAALTQQGQSTQAANVTSAVTTQTVNISHLLQSGQVTQAGNLNQQLTPKSVPNISQLPQAIKSASSTPQSSSSAIPINLPSTNIVWTSPPNVTITSPNGIPVNMSHSAVTGSKLEQTSNVSKELYIDLTDTSEPPAYQVAQQTLSLMKSQPPPRYPAHTLTTTNSTDK